MTGETTHADGQEQGADNYTFGQTSPLRLTDYNGCDHRGKVKLAFDESTLPDDADDEVAADMNWALRAVNGVVHHPNLALWVRTRGRDLIIAHEPADTHERAGHVRAATFGRSHRVEGELSIDSETDAGLLTPFDAVNVLYDFIVGASYRGGYSMVLADIQYLHGSTHVSHPVISVDEHVASWGRHQLLTGSFPRPDDRARTAYPESAYRMTTHENEHDHASEALSEHIEAFAWDDE